MGGGLVVPEKGSGITLPCLDGVIVNTKVQDTILDGRRIDRLTTEQRVLPENRAIAGAEGKDRICRPVQIDIQNVVIDERWIEYIYDGRRDFFLPEGRAIACSQSKNRTIRCHYVDSTVIERRGAG